MTLEFMEDVIGQLADVILTRATACLVPGPRRYMVGIAGMPGSGKTTLAGKLAQTLNSRAGRPLAVVVPMDGFHFLRTQLDEMPDPALAHARRGAAWTFDAEAYVCVLAGLKAGGLGRQACPSFDHGVGDPRPDDIPVLPSHRIVITEGNYLLLDEEPWSRLGDVLDVTLFVDCNVDEAMTRVAARQVANGASPEIAAGRVATNDRPNALCVAATRNRAELVVPSLPYRSVTPVSVLEE